MPQKGISPLRRATADRGGSDELLKKLEQNFQIDNIKHPAKSKFEKQGFPPAVFEKNRDDQQLPSHLKVAHTVSALFSA